MTYIGKGMREDCDFSFANQLNTTIDKENEWKENEQLMDRIIESIRDEVDDDTYEMEATAHELIVAAISGVAIGIILLIVAFSL